MTIEKKILEEKKEFSYGFGNWLGEIAKYVGNGSWIYVNDMDENLHGIFELVESYIEDEEEYEKKERLLNLEKERELVMYREIRNLK